MSVLPPTTGSTGAGTIEHKQLAKQRRRDLAYHSAVGIARRRRVDARRSEGQKPGRVASWLLLKHQWRPTDSFPVQVDGHVDAVADVDEGNAFIHPVVLAVEDHGPMNHACACPHAGNG